MAETKRVRWGILSTADIGLKKVIPGLRRSPRSEVLAIASREDGRAAAAARELSIPRAHGSYEALLADPDIDAVYIPLPNHLHAEWTIAAARAGKHVLCEKPLALTAAQAQGMVDACRDAGVLLMEAFMYRQHPSWIAARSLVESGRIGRLQAVDSWFSYFNDDPRNIRNVADIGGGALYDIGCYSVNLSRMLFASEPTRVQASITRDPVLAHRHGDERDPRLRGWRRHIHLLDARGVGPAGRHLRHRGPDLDRDPVQHPARPADADLRHRRRRSAGRARHRDADVRHGRSLRM